MDPGAYVVDADIATAQSLPPEAYLDPAFAAHERATLWASAWSLLPDAAALPAGNGARAPVELHGAPYFLQRGMDGTLRTLPNVCTHAWHTLVTAPATGKALACPQHGRTFDAAGRCLGQPGMPDTADFPQPSDDLRTLPTERWGPLTFACRGQPAHAFADLLAPVTTSLGDLPVADLRPLGEPSVRTVEGNWKQHAGNYLDQLHIPFIHGTGLGRSVDVGSYQTEIHPHGVLQWAHAKDPHLGFDPAALPKRMRGKHRVYALWWYLWPNLTLNFYPWGLSVNLYTPDPDRPDATRFHWLRWSWDDDKADRIEDWLMTDVDAEDVEALAQVARGLRSGEARRGRFVPGGEASLHWFQRRVYEACFA